ncbi:MAG: VWA domain-containing protein [Hyphomicrobium sp.]|uniref:VWA domain-containing protein n=1 Tax=Hyphomicrobium sp. TaxID=82 RepID=UPI00132320D8|nr:VWA domain-containing protein [Hyphomicrobium sp.]KAB2940909.1 MAG: VWA domain-containing protein [Hyphomicrobium sp.]MBZ0211381.1 VWA domain-containing protein [Hyphomicrobium sp.]
MITRKPVGKTPTPAGDRTRQAPSSPPAAAGVPTTEASADADVAAFIAQMKSVVPAATAERGRLVFAMDATMSRAPTWDMALELQGEMFAAVKAVGGLDVQLVYFRGMGECRASKWVSDPAALARLMRGVACEGGLTQIGKVLNHALDESRRRKVNALVYVGDSMEEDVDRLCARAGELALLGVPVFLFQEGGDEVAARAFREIARLTKGAFCRFDRGSARQLRDLLTAVAVYAAGGRKALLALGQQRDGAGARLLLEQMKPGAAGA